MKSKSKFCEVIFAKSSHSLTKLRMQQGPAGIGVYICILEALYDEPDATLPCDYETIAFRFGLTTEQVRAVVEDYDLFKLSDDGLTFLCELLYSERHPKPKRTATTQSSNEIKEETILLPQIFNDPTVNSLPPLNYNQKVALEIQRFSSLSIKEQTDLLRNDAEWLKYTAMDFRINENELLKHLDNYEHACIVRNDIHYNCADLKYRFVMWVNDVLRSKEE